MCKVSGRFSLPVTSSKNHVSSCKTPVAFRLVTLVKIVKTLTKQVINCSKLSGCRKKRGY